EAEMAGKSNRGRNRRGSHSTTHSSEQAALSESSESAANGIPIVSESDATGSEEKHSGNANPENQAKQGDIHLYPVPVKTQGGEKLELQLSPGDSVMDVRQFLLDAPETCFFTCYDLLVKTKDSSVQLEDYHEISEVADITTGDCSLEMVAAPYDDRSIRAHVHRTRELLTLSTVHSSVSTSLALQHEAGQSTPANSGDPTKTEVKELENLGFMEDVSGSLTNLLSCPSKEIKCMESIVFSSFNPPPSYRRLLGDLIYLDVITLEGNKFCITGTTKTFYVNSSSENILDPRPSKAAFEATTLIGLLQKISSKFKKAFREILERKVSAHPFENVQSLLPPNSWMGLYPVPEHKRDAARAENAMTLSFGSELIGMQRDWNEELQSCREFPHTTPQERILRDRALYKVTSDFVDAAMSGAIGVISRCIPPINPTDPECFHMYVHNNIFFSFAVDADLEQLSAKQASDTGIKIEKTSKILSHGAATVRDNGNMLPRSDAEDQNGITDLVPDVPTETQLAESEQATYASANNDLKGTRAYLEADVPGLYSLAMAIIDYRGHRVVAQSVLPGILQGDKSDSLLYGSVDNGKKICWNESFHSKVLEASKRLHLKEHTVLDGSGCVFKLAAPVECKGIVGSDDRHYLLDLMRVTPRDANHTGPGSRFCILRPELINAYCQAEAAERSNSRCKLSESTSVASDSQAVDDVEVTEASAGMPTSQRQDMKKEVEGEGVDNCVMTPADTAEEILFNPNVFTEFKLAGSQEEIAADEENVRKVSLYLRDVVIPKFIHDLCTLEVSPMDGQTLTEALHALGINVRYIGKVADGTKHLPHLWDLCSNEIVVRSAKHMLKDILRDSEDHDLAPAIARFFNCFFGNGQAVANSAQSIAHKVKKDFLLLTLRIENKYNLYQDHAVPQASGNFSRGHARWKSGGSARRKQSAYTHLTSDSLWSDILEFAKFKYQFEVPADARSRVKKISVIRNLCQKGEGVVGVWADICKSPTRAEGRQDNGGLSEGWTVEDPRQLGLDGGGFSWHGSGSIEGVVVLIWVQVGDDGELSQVGVTIAARKYDLEALLPFQTLDILNLQPSVKHSIPVCSEAKDLVETGKVQLAEGMLSEAYTLFSEAFTILQQVTGPMHREVGNCCRYLAMVLYHAGDMAGAIMQQHKELIINERCLGLDHPDTAHSYGNMALFYHGLNQTELALRHMSRALILLSLSSGPDHPDVAATYINHEKRTYDILVKQLGKDDSRTRDSETWINTFKKRELQMNEQKQKGQALNAASAQKAIDHLLKVRPELKHALQAANVAGGSGSTSASANKSAVNAAIVGETLPQGRGISERVRKKAAARGLLAQRAAPVQQPLPPLSQLLDLMNSIPDAANNDTGGVKKEVNGHPSNVQGDAQPLDAQEDGPKQGQQDQTPVGLGTGLASHPRSRKQNPN
ncbi:hypothetical protein RJ639_044150, partial [Escallonia herrerae]